MLGMYSNGIHSESQFLFYNLNSKNKLLIHLMHIELAVDLIYIFVHCCVIISCGILSYYFSPDSIICPETINHREKNIPTLYTNTLLHYVRRQP